MKQDRGFIDHVDSKGVEPFVVLHKNLNFLMSNEWFCHQMFVITWRSCQASSEVVALKKTNL